MNEFDTRVFDQLDALTPEPARRPQWDDVLLRARTAHIRRVVIAVAAAVVCLGSAAAVTAALGGFDRWLSGEPGKPAPRSEQQRFEEANSRSLAAFPKGTELRELIETEVDGKRYVLYGFRSGNTLCLKLKAVSLGHSTGTSCTPRAIVADATPPIVIVNRETGFQDRHARASAQASFGIVADGVGRVDVRAVDGVHRAVLGGNAYLYVQNEPNTGNRVLGVSATSAGGKRSTISFGTTFGLFDASSEATPPPKGPRRVQVRIAHPKIGWYARGERRGLSSDQLKLHMGQGLGVSPTGRFVKPDPLSDIVVGLDGNLCLILVPGPNVGVGCNAGPAFFARGPLNVMMAGGGGAESLVVAGAAADGVVRLTIFASDGQRLSVPLRDNLFAARVPPAQFPIRLVGYDRSARIAAVQTLQSRFGGTTLPASAWRPSGRSLHATGPNGATATLTIGRDTRKFRCWQAHFSSGESRRGCKPTYPTGPFVDADLVQPAGRDLFVIGNVRAPVELVKLRFADGQTLTMRPLAGLYLFAIPREQLRPSRQLAFVRGYDERSQVVQRAPVLFKRVP